MNDDANVPQSTVNTTGQQVPADAPAGGVQPMITADQDAPTSYAAQVASPAAASSVASNPNVVSDAGIGPDDENFGTFFVNGQAEGLDLAAAKQGIVHVYDHDGDGYPEFADVQPANGGPLKQHVPLPDVLKGEPNATAARVPILNPAVCAATGMVVERHELVNGILPQLNSPGIAYGEKSRGQGTQDVGVSNPYSGATARDMASQDRVHERFANLEAAIFGGGKIPAQPSNAALSSFGGAIDAHANAANADKPPQTSAFTGASGPAQAGARPSDAQQTTQDASVESDEGSTGNAGTLQMDNGEGSTENYDVMQADQGE